MATSDVHKVHVYGHGATVECPHGPPFPSLPSSWIFSGPTCSGKSQAWLSLILRVYKGMWDRVFVFSPSIMVDDSYAELRKYLDKMSPKEKLYYEDLDQNVLGKIIADQTAICEMCKKRKVKCPEILIAIDDMADRSDVLNRRSGARNGGSHILSLAVRGRHSHISWICSTQCLNLVCLPIRKNVRNLVIYRARSAKEIDSLCEELAAVYNKETLLALYEKAVNDQPYSFLNIKLDAADRKDMFWLRWEARLIPEDPDIEESDGEQPVEHGKRENRTVRPAGQRSDPGPGRARSTSSTRRLLRVRA
jgi:hypothetical protein